MKATGIVRKVDELGRIVLPIELRRNMNIDIKDSIEIFVDEGAIILKNMNLQISLLVILLTWLSTKVKKFLGIL